jgi:hypothetical protein
VGAFRTRAEGNTGKVDYPEGYRQWPHVKSMVLQEAIRFMSPSAAFTTFMPTPRRWPR